MEPRVLHGGRSDEGRADFVEKEKHLRVQNSPHRVPGQQVPGHHRGMCIRVVGPLGGEGSASGVSPQEDDLRGPSTACAAPACVPQIPQHQLPGSSEGVLPRAPAAEDILRVRPAEHAEAGLNCQEVRQEKQEVHREAGLN